MTVYSEIFAATDGSPAAQEAVRVAGVLAGALDVPLSLVNAWTESGPDAYLGATELTTAAEGLARSYGAATVRRLEPGASGPPGDVLIDLADASPESLLIIGDRGFDSDGERLGGNTAHQVTHHGQVDLLMVVEGGGTNIARIATTTDGSTTATRGVYRGVDLARALGVVPDILTVAKSQEEGEAALSGVVEDLDRRGIPTRPQVLVASGRGSVAATLLEAGAGYDLMVIGNRGMSGPSRMLGSVSHRVTHRAATNLLLVRTVL